MPEKRKKSDKYHPRPDGRYGAKIRTGRYDDNGKPESIQLYAKSSKELEELVAETKYRLKIGDYQAPTKITVGDYAIKWYETFKGRKELNTKVMYKNVIDKHIVPSIGYIKLQDLTFTDCQRMINDRFDHYETCNKIALTMKQIQKRAKLDKIITDEFWVDIEMPPKPESKKRTLTELEKRAIKEAAFSVSDRAFVYMLFGCGLRREEALALCVSDVNLQARTISVSNVIVFDVNTPILKPAPKTKNGYRTIPIPAAVFPEIKFHVLQKVGKEKNPLILKNMFLFTSQSGGMVSKSSYRKMWERIVKKMNEAVGIRENPKPINGLTAHIFRHNYATLLYYSGLSELKAVELLGHADGSMIRQVYAHLDEAKEETAMRIDHAICL